MYSRLQEMEKMLDVTVEPKMVEVESYDTGFVVYGDR